MEIWGRSFRLKASQNCKLNACMFGEQVNPLWINFNGTIPATAIGISIFAYDMQVFFINWLQFLCMKKRRRYSWKVFWPQTWHNGSWKFAGDMKRQYSYYGRKVFISHYRWSSMNLSLRTKNGFRYIGLEWISLNLKNKL